MHSFSAYRRWGRFRILPRIFWGYDRQRIAFAVGVKWLYGCATFTRYWNRNGCVFVR